MMYKVWNSISYTECEDLVPFTLVYESDDLDKVNGFLEEKSDGIIYFVLDINNNFLSKNTLGNFNKSTISKTKK